MNKKPLRKSYKMGMSLKHASWNTELKTDSIRKVREMATCLPYCPHSRLEQHQAERSPLSLQFLQWEKRAQEWHLVTYSNVGHFVEAPTLVLPHRDSKGLYSLQTLGIWLWHRKGGELQTNQHSDLGRPSSYLQKPISSPNRWLCYSAEPSQWCSLIRELSGVQSCLIWVLKRGV